MTLVVHPKWAPPRDRPTTHLVDGPGTTIKAIHQLQLRSCVYEGDMIRWHNKVSGYDGQGIVLGESMGCLSVLNLDQEVFARVLAVPTHDVTYLNDARVVL